jgi:hypothetical protein
MQNCPNLSQPFLTASELKAVWLAATELFLDIEMASPIIFDLALFACPVERIAYCDPNGKLTWYPILSYGPFRLAYDDKSNTLYVGRL